MKYRKLRIMFSALCAIACIALTFLWIQSYFSISYVGKQLSTGALSLQTRQGGLEIWYLSPQLAQLQPAGATWSFGNNPAGPASVQRLMDPDELAPELFGFRFESTPLASVCHIPLWAILLPVAAAGALPWIKLRLSWRIATSTFFVLTTILLLGLWERSYKAFDVTDITSAANLCSMKGQLHFGETFMLIGKDSLNTPAPAPASVLGITTLPAEKFDLIPFGGVAIPYWLAVAVVAPLAAVPWLRFRFSLRTMLIATALIATALTVIILALRR